MFLVSLLVYFALSSSFEVKAIAVNNIYYQQAPIKVRSLKMTEYTLMNISSLPDHCFSQEEEENNITEIPYNDVTLYPYLKRRRSFTLPTTNPSEMPSTMEVFNENFTTSNHSSYIDFSNLNDELYSCELWEIEDGCYQVLPNHSVYVPIYNRLYGTSDHLIRNGYLLICSNHLTESLPPKFSKAYEVVSTIGLGISTACMILHMLTFIMVDSLRNLPGYCLFSLCVSLIIGYSSVFAIQTLEREDDCTYIGMMMFYFFMASFFWMNILSYDVWRSLRMATSKLRLNTRIWFRFGVYSAYCWGSAGLVVMCAVIIDMLGDVPFSYRLQFKKKTCWFEFKEALLVYFFLPFLILLVVDLIFFVWSLIMITSATMKTAENKTVLWSRFCVFLRLAIIMGLTWIFAVIAAVTNTYALWYFYVIFNTSQGVLIFFSFSCGQKTRKTWKSRIQKRNNSATPTLYSSQSQQYYSTPAPGNSQSEQSASKV